MAKLYMATQLIKTADSFKSYVNKLNINNKYNEFDKIKDKLLESLSKMENQLCDLELSMESRSYFNNIKRNLNALKNTISSATTLDTLFLVKDLVHLLDEINQLNNEGTYVLSGIAYDYYANYTDAYDLPANHMRDLYNSIKNTNPLNIFSIYCNSGTNISNFKRDKDKTYGNTLNYAATAKTRLDRVIKGALKGSFISNNFFDVVLLTPTVTYVTKIDAFGKMQPAEEGVEIRNCLKYVRQGGLYVVTIPVTRIDGSLASWLSKVLSDDTIVVKIPGDQLHRVTIMGRKEVTNKAKQDLLNRLTNIDYDKLPVASDLAPIFDIPLEVLELEYFRGSQLDVDDLLEAAVDAGIDNFLFNQTQPLVVKDQSPLLPFNIGQVGLVLTSGCLDGVVEEMDGVYHVIKGMTTKLSTVTTDDSEENQLKSTETISNRVKINVFTADGKFIELG
jgi:hypothetical protein